MVELFSQDLNSQFKLALQFSSEFNLQKVFQVWKYFGHRFTDIAYRVQAATGHAQTVWPDVGTKSSPSFFPKVTQKVATAAFM